MTEQLPVSMAQVEQLSVKAKIVEIKQDMTIYEALEEQGYVRWDDDEKKYVRKSPFVVQLNSVWLKESGCRWLYKLQPGDVLRVERLAAKGGGGGGSKGLGVIMAVVAIVAAPFTGGMSLLLLVPAAALLIGGTVAVPKTTASSLSNKDSTSPTYSLTAQTNQARLLSAVPRVYGKVKVVPDLASQPYVEFIGNDQYLYELFAISCGKVAIKEMYFDDTPLSTLGGAEVQIIPPYGQVTLFPDNVATSASVDGIQLEEDSTIAGPYVVAPVATKTSKIGVDFTMPSGCYTVDSQSGAIKISKVEITVFADPVDDNGAVIGPRIALYHDVVSFATQQPQRFSLQFDMPTASYSRYQVGCYRSGAGTESDSKIQNTLVWSGLKAYLLDETHNYGNVTLVAVKMKSSGVLNSNTARSFKCLCVGMIPLWSPIGGFTEEVESQSIAWAAADILHNSDYGKGMDATRIDLAGLFALEQTWIARGDTFNGSFDTTTSIWDALTKVLRAGRAAPIYYAGLVEFIRDQPQSLPVAMFDPRNITAGSLSVQHKWPTSETPDYVTIQYMDQDTWTQKEVDCVLPNTIATKQATVELFGVTSRAQAYREGMFMAAVNQVRRRTVRFSCEMEGQVVRYNDLIQISHDVADWGYSGEVLSFNRTTGRIRTSEPIPFTSNSYVIAFKRKNGSSDGPYKLIQDSSITDQDTFGGVVQATTAQLAAIYISDGIRSEYTSYQAGPTNKAGLKALVSKVTAKGDDKYDIECVGYVASVYGAETGQVAPYPESPSNLVRPPVGPVINRITVRETTTPGQQVCQITPAVGAMYYTYQLRLSNGSWSDLLGATQETAIALRLDVGTQAVRARAVGATIPGPWVTWSGNIEGGALDLPRLSSFVTTPALLGVQLNWDFTEDTRLIADKTRIYVSDKAIPDLERILLVGEFPFPMSTYVYNLGAPGQSLYFWAHVVDKAGRVGPWYNNATAVPGSTSDDPAALLAMLQGEIGASLLTQALQDTITSLISNDQTLATAVANNTQQIVDNNQATVNVLNQIQAQVNENNTAIIAQVSEVKAGLDGTLSAMTTIRAQLRSDGKLITAGIGIGVTPDPNDPTQHNSEIILQAGRLAFVTSQANDPLVAPLVVQGTSVFMHGAFVMDLTVTNAKIANANVDTLKIAGASVIGTEYAENSGGNLAGGQTINISSKTLTMPSGASGIVVTGMLTVTPSGANGTYIINILVNGAVVSTTSYSASNGFATSLPFTGFAVPVEGGNTVVLQLVSPAAGSGPGSGVAAAFTQSKMMILGAKR